jgi:chromate transporter
MSEDRVRQRAGPATDDDAGRQSRAEPPRRPRSPGELFRVFNRLALQGFGGVLPVAQRELVERERWLGQAEFLETLSLCQVLPGPNVVNMALMIGDRFFGWRGAAAAASGLLLAPLLIVLVLAAGYNQLSSVPAVAGALRGMGVVAAGLVIATAIKLAGSLRGSPLGLWACGLVGALSFVAIGVQRWPLVGVVLGLGGAAVAFAWWRLRP